MKNLFIFLLSLSPFLSFATRHVQGTGSGLLTLNTQFTNGDTIAIAPGTYTGATVSASLHDMFITNNAGKVTFTGSIDFGVSGNTMTNLTWDGSGDPSNLYGFYFDATGSFGDGGLGYNSGSGFVITASHIVNVNFYHIWFNGLIANGFDFSGSNFPTYDGTTGSLKAFNCKFLYNREDDCDEFFQGSYKAPNSSFMDSIEIAYNIFNQTNGNGLTVNAEITHFNIHHNQILYSGYNALPNDVGVFSITGFGIGHHNYMKGGRGWMFRLNGCSLKPVVSTNYIYNNIKIGTTTYGMTDARSDSINFFAPQSGFFMHCNFEVSNNTFGNQTANDANGTGTGNNYNTPVVLFYHMDNGCTGKVKNNLGFNSIIGASGGYICISFATDQNNVALGFTKIDTSNNRYYPANQIGTVLADTNAYCALKPSVPLIGAGVFLSYVVTDFSDRTRPNPPSIGGEEFASAPPPPPNPCADCLPGLPSHKFHRTSKKKFPNLVSCSKPTLTISGTQTITLPTNTVSEVVQGVSHSSTGIASYKWKQISGPTVTIVNTSSSTTQIVGITTSGTYSFRAIVTDSCGYSDSATTSLIVNPTILLTPQIGIVYNTGTVTFKATVKSRDGGTITKVGWGKISGPGTQVITGANTTTGTISGLQTGNYNYKITAWDSKGTINADTVNFSISAIPKSLKRKK